MFRKLIPALLNLLFAAGLQIMGYTNVYLGIALWSLMVLDLIGGGKNHIRHGDSWPTSTGKPRCGNAITKVGQERHEAPLFLALGGVVRGPVSTSYHLLSILSRASITTTIWLIYAEFPRYAK